MKSREANQSELVLGIIGNRVGVVWGEEGAFPRVRAYSCTGKFTWKKVRPLASHREWANIPKLHSKVHIPKM